MGVTLTPEAVEVIRRSLELAGADTDELGVRLRVAGGQVRPRFAPAPEPGDVVVEAGDVRVFVERSVAESHPEVEIAVSAEHDTLVVRPGAA